MHDFDREIELLRDRWDSPAAQEIVRNLVTSLWQAGGPNDQTRHQAAAIRQMLQTRLSAAPPSAEQFALLNISYLLEQGLGNRDEALDLAGRVELLSRQVAAPIQRVRALFQMAKALLYVDRNADAVRWTRRGLQQGDQLEQAAASEGALGDAELAELRRLLADQESRQVNRMATLGGMNAEVDQAVESVLNRWATLNEPSGMASALGMLVEARSFQGRWADAAELARKALAAVGYPPTKDPGIAYALCFGGLALCRLGDAQTALAWATDSASVSQDVANHECLLEARAVHAVALAATGRIGEAVSEIDGVVHESAVLNMGELTGWVVGLRGWLRMNARLPTPPDELLEAYQYLADHGYRVVAAEVLYATVCALHLAGRDNQKELSEAIAQFEQFGMVWHLERARRGALIR